MVAVDISGQCGARSCQHSVGPHICGHTNTCQKRQYLHVPGLSRLLPLNPMRILLHYPHSGSWIQGNLTIRVIFHCPIPLNSHTAKNMFHVSCQDAKPWSKLREMLTGDPRFWIFGPRKCEQRGNILPDLEQNFLTTSIAFFSHVSSQKKKI